MTVVAFLGGLLLMVLGVCAIAVVIGGAILRARSSQWDE